MFMRLVISRSTSATGCAAPGVGALAAGAAPDWVFAQPAKIAVAMRVTTVARMIPPLLGVGLPRSCALGETLGHADRDRPQQRVGARFRPPHNPPMQRLC